MAGILPWVKQAADGTWPSSSNISETAGPKSSLPAPCLNRNANFIKGEKIMKIPKFKSLEAERVFWDTHSITEFLDELKPVKVEFSRPKKKLISIRLETP